MVSSWAENPPTATTHRCTGSSTSSDPARKYADPASLKNPYASSSRVNPATVLTQNVIRDAQFWAHQAFHPATHHIIMTRSSQLGLAITAGAARPLLTQPALTHHHGSGRERRTVAGTPPPIPVLRHSQPRRVAELLNTFPTSSPSIRGHRSRPLMRGPQSLMGRSLTWHHHAAR